MTLRSSSGGRSANRGASRGPGYYVPPVIEVAEDTTQPVTAVVAPPLVEAATPIIVAPPLVEAAIPITVTPPLVEVTAFLELQHATPEQAAEVLEGLARYALRPPRQSASLVSDSSDPWSLITATPDVTAALPPIIEEPAAEAELHHIEPSGIPIYESGLMSHNITPLGYCPLAMPNIGLSCQPPCAFVSQYGQRVHLYNDGRCLNNVNVRSGVRQLKALPVCLICTARWRAAGSPGSSSGR
jgi:hypothetical protein